MAIQLRKYKSLDIGGIAILLLLFLWFRFFILPGASSADAIFPEFMGIDLQMNGNLMLDCSDSSNGYVLASVMSPSGNAMKMRVTFNGMQLMYDLDNTGQQTIIPLQLGSGTYEFALFESAGGSKYSAEGSITLAIQLNSETAAFLVPNQYVNYTRETPTIAKSDEITAGLTGQEEIYQAVCNFMASEFSYDFVRAQTISPGTLPEIPNCYANRAGICQDLAAVMCSMLRVQGVPCRLVIGYADGYYHAWTVASVNGEDRFFDPTAAIGAMNASNYQIERYY